MSRGVRLSMDWTLYGKVKRNTFFEGKRRRHLVDFLVLVSNTRMQLKSNEFTSNLWFYDYEMKMC